VNDLSGIAIENQSARVPVLAKDASNPIGACLGKIAESSALSRAAQRSLENPCSADFQRRV